MTAGRTSPGRQSEAGFSLVALFAGITIMFILMGAAMPSWKYVVQNEREQELYFRGNSIATAIERYQKKNANTAPPSLEVLVKGRYLRKAYEDPMTEDGKWRFIRMGEVAAARMSEQAGAALPGSAGTTPSAGGRLPGTAGTVVRGGAGPFIGVASRSEEKSLRIMNGAESYDQWLFVAGRPRVLGKNVLPMPTAVQPGVPGAPGAPAPGPAPGGTQTQPPPKKN